ncbi:hypothetical protein K456DRAFT_1456458 [Colletotrichum gloeosporioides 23]|nr:hypothetical protein K456DRAFT_1456458 [Colletotrichum gloeosporioides 23]
MPPKRADRGTSQVTLLWRYSRYLSDSGPPRTRGLLFGFENKWMANEGNERYNSRQWPWPSVPSIAAIFHRQCRLAFVGDEISGPERAAVSSANPKVSMLHESPRWMHQTSNAPEPLSFTTGSCGSLVVLSSVSVKLSSVFCPRCLASLSTLRIHQGIQPAGSSQRGFAEQPGLRAVERGALRETRPHYLRVVTWGQGLVSSSLMGWAMVDFEIRPSLGLREGLPRRAESGDSL